MLLYPNIVSLYRLKISKQVSGTKNKQEILKGTNPVLFFFYWLIIKMQVSDKKQIKILKDLVNVTWFNGVGQSTLFLVTMLKLQAVGGSRT